MMMNNEKKRIEWIDVIKFICIFFVMASHVGDLKMAPLLRKFYSPFFLSAFLFASGYTYRHKEGFLQHLKKKAAVLLVPWFFFSTLTRIAGQLRHFGIDIFIEDMKWNFLQIRGLDDGMWFVAALFIAYIPFYFIIAGIERKKEKDSSNKVLFLLASCLIFAYYIYISIIPAEWFPWGKNALPWHIEYIPFANGCMLFGYVSRRGKDVFPDWLLEKRRLVCLVVIYLFGVYVPDIAGMQLPVLAGCFYNVLLTISGIAFVCAVSKMVHANRFILFVGRNTLIYFGLQGEFIFLLETIWKLGFPSLFSTISGYEFLSGMYSVLMGGILCVLLIIPAIIINRYFPFIIGRKGAAVLK